MADRTLQLAILSAEVAVGAISACHRQKSEAKLEEAAIREQIEALAAAVRAADLEAVMARYAPDIVTFDIVPPLQKIGADGKRKNWMDVFATHQHPLGYEIRDLAVTIGGDVAFAHSLNRLSGALKDGTKIDQWVRWTAGLRKIDGRWLIVHDHVSAPTDVATGKSMLYLEP